MGPLIPRLNLSRRSIIIAQIQPIDEQIQFVLDLNFVYIISDKINNFTQYKM